MEPRSDWMNEIQRGISDLIAKSPAADLEKNIRALMTQTFARMDLITREEFDMQVELLERALHKVQQLEKRVVALEKAAGIDTTATSQATPQQDEAEKPKSDGLGHSGGDAVNPDSKA